MAGTRLLLVTLSGSLSGTHQCLSQYAFYTYLRKACLYWVVSAMGPENRAAVWVWTGKMVQSGSRPSQKLHLPGLGGVITQTGQKPMVFWPGCTWTVVSYLRFLQLSLQLSISVLIVSGYDQKVDCAVLVALSSPAFRFAIQLIFLEWL